MANIAEVNDSYDDGVYLLAVTDPVLGGPEGPDNKAAINLANRTRFQRMRNVTPWRPGVENPYPAHAYCQYAGATWKSVAAHANVQPGTDVTKWIRWGHTEAELQVLFAAYLASGVLDPYALDIDLNAYVLSNSFNARAYAYELVNHGGNCPVTGPAAAPTVGNPYTKYTSVAPYLENWTWTATTGWKVTSNHYESPIINAVSTALAGGNNLVHTAALPRKGKIFVYAYSFIPAATAATHTVLAQVSGGTVFGGTRSVATSGVEAISSLGVTMNVDTDSRNLLLYAYPALAGAPSHGSLMKYQYVD